ncbi:MAG: PQQ-dependent sugar dehydrogenase [Gemmatimonadaceae bacterium]|nr:PQQ-dependent sugar dehydrogenase [Gemmatimonadaceae bacterium]
MMTFRTPLLRSAVTLTMGALVLGCDAPTASTDSTAPTAALTSPAAATEGLTGALTLTATANDSAGIATVDFAIDGTIVGSDASAPYEANITSTAAYASGTHTISVRATDVNGNRSSWVSTYVTFGGSVARPSTFSQATLVSGFGSQLTAIAVAPDGRLFVTEKDGAIRVVRDGLLNPVAFATVTVATGSERGLLGIALSPDFGTTGLVYVYYTTAQGGVHNRISVFQALGDVASSVDQVLVDLPALSSAENHNGGAMAFGADGKLYVAVGDNANGSLAPALTSVFGKILRYNADGSIPTDNPFSGTATGGNRAIWARGLRNPYTFAFQQSTGRLHINDVGEGSWEEINLGRAGADYGWPSTEGPTSASGVDAPIFAYGHTNSPTLFEGAAIIGAAFYEPLNNRFGSGYTGDYFFSDFDSGMLYRMDVATGAVGAFASVGSGPTNLAVSLDGTLLVTIGTRIERITR